MDKYDLKKDLKAYYVPGGKDFELVEVPEIHFLAVDGAGDPNTAAEYTAAVEALFSVSYTLKFLSKGSLQKDYVVAPLEGLWRAENIQSFTTRDKNDWQWTMLIAQPDWIDSEMIEAARQKVLTKKGLAGGSLRAVRELRSLRYAEGLSVQIMHRGSYDDEGPTLHRLHHEYMPQHGLGFNGDHHEIYLSDVRRTAPEKLKTVLRQPVKRLDP